MISLLYIVSVPKTKAYGYDFLFKLTSLTIKIITAYDKEDYREKEN